MDSEIEVLDRTLLRLSSTEDHQLSPMLEKVLPRLLLLLKRDEAPVRDKCIQVLGHIHERCHNTNVVRVPLAQLLDLYRSESCQRALVSSFLIKFVEIGFEGADPSERVSLLNCILDHISERFSTHRPVLIRMIISALPHIVFSNNPVHNRSLFPALLNTADKRWLLATFRDVLLLHPTTQSGQSPNGPEFGFSTESWQGVSKIDRSINGLKDTKLSVLRFLISSGFFEPIDVFILGLIASSDSSGEVVDLREVLFRRFGKPGFNEPSIPADLLALYLGDDTHRCASFQLKMQIIPVLCKSTYAIQHHFSSILKVIFDSAFGQHSILKLTQYGMELLSFTLRNSNSQYVNLASSALLAALLKLFKRFNENSISKNFQSSRIRSLVYDSIAHLISLNPSICVSTTQIPVFFFRMLQSDVDEVQGDIKVALSLLASVYAEHGPASTKTDLKNLLSKNCFAHDASDAVRQMSLVWLSRLFPFSDVETRYISLLMVADSSNEVKETALKSLIPGVRVGQELSQAPVFPTFCEMMSYTVSRGALLNQPVTVLKQAVIFLRMCLYSEVQRKGSSSLSILLFTISENAKSLLIQFTQLLYAPFEKNFPSSSALHDLRFEASSTILQIVTACPSLFLEDICRSKLEWAIDALTTSVEEGTRLNFSKLLGLMFSSSFITQESLRSTLKKLTVHVTDSSNDNNFLHGCCLGIGYIVGSCIKLPPTRGVKPRGHRRWQRLMLLHRAQKLCDSLPLAELRAASETVIKLLESNNPLICSGACVAISTICSMGRVPLKEHEIEDVYANIISRLLNLSRACQMESQVSEKSILALGCIPAYASDKAISKVIDSLLSLSNIRHDDLLFSIGDALVQCCSMTNDEILLLSLTNRLTEEFISNGSVIARCSGSVWLLFLTKSFLLKLSQSGGESFLIGIQASFSSLLSESRLLTQESASKGLAILFQQSSTEIRNSLVRELLRSAPSIKKEKEESAVKEFFGIAKELGKPSLVYQLLDISCSHTIWSSKYGAQFSTNSLQRITSLLQPDIKFFIPKLYRYQFDPIAQIKKTMKAVYPIDSSLVKENFDAIIKDLIACMIERDARVRQSTCAALQELISGRPFAILNPYLEILLRNVFLVLDDLNDSVRAAALSLSIALSSILERICDVSLASPTEASFTIVAVLPVLLDNGMQSKSKEVNSIAISTLVRVITASGVLIVPHIPRLLRVLLEALSSMEAQILNYAMFHTATINVTQEQLEAVRLSLSKSSPITSALESCSRKIDESVVNEIVIILSDILKQGTGLPTMDGTAQFLSAVIIKLPLAVAPHARQLIATILQCIYCSGRTVRKSLCIALGQLANIANEADVEFICTRIQKLFVEENYELCAMICKELIERVDTVKLKPHYTKLIPVCYIGKFSSEEISAQLWKQCLEESSLGVSSSILNHSEDIISLAVKTLNQSSYECKKMASMAIAEVINVAESKITSNFDLINDSLIACISCPNWDGKSFALSAFTSLLTTCCDTVRSREMVPRILEIFQTESRRSADTIYLKTIFLAMRKLSSVFGELDFLSVCVSVAQKTLQSDTNSFNETNSKAMQADLISEILSCISACWSPSSGVSYAETAFIILACLRGQEVVAQGAAFSSLKTLLAKGLGALPHSHSSDIIESLFPILLAAIRDGKHESIRGPALDIALLLTLNDALGTHEASMSEVLKQMSTRGSATIGNKRQKVLSLIERKSNSLM